MSDTSEIPTLCVSNRNQNKVVLASHDWPADSNASCMYRLMRPVVVRIKHRDGIASGFFLDRDRTLIATAHHVHSPNDSYEIQTADGLVLEARKLCFYTGWSDIAILLVEDSVEWSGDEWPIETFRWGQLWRGQQLIAIGHPLGEEEAHVSVGSFWKAHNDIFTFSMLIQPGLSGSIVCAVDGAVVAMLTRGGNPDWVSSGTSSRSLYTLYKFALDLLKKKTEQAA